MYHYENCLLLIHAMIRQAKRDSRRGKLERDWYIYRPDLFLEWCAVWLAGYLEDVKGEE